MQNIQKTIELMRGQKARVNRQRYVPRKQEALREPAP